MRVSAKAEYACVALVQLAAHHGSPHPVRVKEIAEAHGIPQRFLVQILLQLKAAGLVASTRGAAGGYQLSRPPSAISLADVIYRIDSDPPRTDSVASADTPFVHAVRSAWKDVQTAERRLLEQVTLAELVQRAQESEAPFYHI